MTIKIDSESLSNLLDYWLDKVDPCYYEEVKASMGYFILTTIVFYMISVLNARINIKIQHHYSGGGCYM